MSGRSGNTGGRWSHVPVDLRVVVVALGLAWVVTLGPVVRDSPVRVAVGLVLTLFVPGYAVVAALYPEASTVEGGLDGLERLVFAVGASVVVVPLVGLVLNFTPWGVRPVPVLVGLSLVSGVATVVATRRRRRLSPDRRLDVDPTAWWGQHTDHEPADDSRTGTVLSVLFVASLLLAAGAVGYAVVSPPTDETYSELSLRTTAEDGSLVAEGYPTRFHRGESRSLVVGVDNHEGERVEYTVVVVLQRVTIENGSIQVADSRELDRFGRSVEAGGTWLRQTSLRPTMQGHNLRLGVLLYRDDVPAEPTLATAYRETHLWVTVAHEGNSSDADGQRTTP
jgi:uncharacterized membrane protein